ncbi:pre-toxin TG domain-containing protein [Aerococcaceae bacterium NML130460]|nr:pre-toxin TG domain-containing protein [Aerococcaceae bacterium NML130460]
MYKNMKKMVVSALCSVALAGLFTRQVSAYENEMHEVNHIGEVYHDETTDFLEEYGWYPEEETADDRDDLSEEDTDEVKDAEDLPDIDTSHVEYDTVEVLEGNITDNAMDAFVVVETDEVNEQAGEEDDELLEDWDELNTWTLEALLHELALLEQIQTQPHTEDLADTTEDEGSLTDVEIEDILNGTPTTLEELELYFYTKLGTDPFLMEYFYKNLNTDKLLVEYFKGVEAFDLPEGYFTRTDEENRKLRAYFYQVLQVDPYFRDYFYRSEDTPEALEDKEMTEGTTFFRRGGRRPAYRPAPKPVYRPRPRPVYRPVNRPTQAARPVAKPTPKPNVKPAAKPTFRPAARPVTRPNIAPIPPKSTPPKPNPPMQAPKTSSALEAANVKLPGGPTGPVDLKRVGHLIGEFTGYYDVKRLITGVDPITGQKANRLEATGSLVIGFIPGGFGKAGKLADAMNDLRKGSVVAKAVDIAGDTTRATNAVDKLNDSRKVANAADKAVDAGKAVANNAGDVAQGTKKSGRAANKIYPDPNATGDHTVFKQDKATGAITNYRTYETNPYNPSGFQEVKGFDGIGRGHKNSLTNIKVETPHVTSKTIPGGVRVAAPWEIPTSLQNIIP